MKNFCDCGCIFLLPISCYAIFFVCPYFSIMYHAIIFKEAKGIIIHTFEGLEAHAIKSLDSALGMPKIYPSLLNQNARKL